MKTETPPTAEPLRSDATNVTGRDPSSYHQCERVAIFGRYAVFAPYESHDETMLWTVQRVDRGSDPEDTGSILAEFEDRFDAELFAEAKYESDEAGRLDKLSDDVESSL